MHAVIIISGRYFLLKSAQGFDVVTFPAWFDLYITVQCAPLNIYVLIIGSFIFFSRLTLRSDRPINQCPDLSVLTAYIVGHTVTSYH